MILALIALMGLGDGASAALISGMITLVNTGMTAVLLKWVSSSRREIQSTHTSAAHAATAAAAASEAAVEACRVAKAIGAKMRHEDPIIVKHTRPPELES